MSWPLVFALSLFGLAMAVATVFWIPSNVEPFFWLAILGVAAFAIATRAPGRYFQHGLALGILNGVWMTSGHMVFVDTYVARHPAEAEMMAGMGSPRLAMLPIGLGIGVLSGCIFGLVALALSKRFGRRPSAVSPTPV